MIVSRYIYCFQGILIRELLRFTQQYGRFAASLVRPLVWLFVFSIGLRSVIQLPPLAPYGHSVAYQVYVVPGLVAMILLFSGMQSALSIVYDREMGSMRALLISPFPRWYLLLSKVVSGVFFALIQVMVFITITSITIAPLPFKGYALLLPIAFLCGLMMYAFGLLLSSCIKQLENFAGVMNFILFPMFFASTGLYPLEQLKHSSISLYYVALFNPLTHAVELIRYALVGSFNLHAFSIVLALTVLLLALSFIAYNPSKRFHFKNERV